MDIRVQQENHVVGVVIPSPEQIHQLEQQCKQRKRYEHDGWNAVHETFKHMRQIKPRPAFIILLYGEIPVHQETLQPAIPACIRQKGLKGVVLLTILIIRDT